MRRRPGVPGGRAAVLPRLHLDRGASTRPAWPSWCPGWPTGAVRSGRALLGGEMAEHAGVMKPGEFDLVGFAVGVVERDADARARPGRGGRRPHRAALAGPALQRLHPGPPRPAGAGRPLTSTRRPGRGPDDLAGRRAAPALGHLHPGGAGGHAPPPTSHAAAHITGGGFAGNLPRALPEGMRAVVDRATWEVPPHLRRDPSPGRGRPTTRWPGCSTSGSAWWWWSAPARAATPWPRCAVPAWTRVAGGPGRGRRAGRRVDRHGPLVRGG